MKRDLLSIINAMLRVTGEFAIDSELETHPDVAVCTEIVENFKNELLSTGWWFNRRVTTYEVSQDGKIYVPSTVIYLDAYDTSRNVDQHDDVLYDADNNTYLFTQPVKLNVILDMDVENLPPVMYNYLKAVCVSEYAGISQVTGEPMERAQINEARTLRELERTRLRKEDINFSDNPMSQRMFAFRQRYGTYPRYGYRNGITSRVKKY